ncbi:MAG: hypothetical protein C6H99_03830 [Epsilonproteobacteria bacterium]|nr:hypothetical protein [Campylobacterota bacterium]NPA64938.1 hypothetical protein [Campylobacterota bacterium]
MISLKDKTIAYTLKSFFNLQIKEYGQLLNLQIDSKSKRIKMELMLAGEKEPIEVEIGSYEIREREGKHYILIKNLKASREWIDMLARSYLDGYCIEIPAQLAKALKLIV